MNNGIHHNGNSLPPARTGGNGNGSRPYSVQPNIPVSQHGAGVEHIPATAAPEALHWDALAPVVSEALAQPLETALVSQRKGCGGRQFSYIEGHTAIDQTNQVFGYGGWGYELVGDVTMRTITSDRLEDRLSHLQRRLFGCRASHRAGRALAHRCRLPGRSRTSRPRVTKRRSRAAVTDARKRVLGSFGDLFGNGLYTGSSPAQAGDPPSAAHGSRDAERSSGPLRPAASGRSGGHRAPNQPNQAASLPAPESRLSPLIFTTGPPTRIRHDYDPQRSNGRLQPPCRTLTSGTASMSTRNGKLASLPPHALVRRYGPASVTNRTQARSPT